MEESEKRRERLRAMRLEEAAAAAGGGGGGSLRNNNQQLSNPLLDYEEASPVAAVRFDYYTDPLSAYSSHKHSHLSHRNPSSTSAPYRPPHFQPPGLGCGTAPYPPQHGSLNFRPQAHGWGPRPNPGLGYGGSPSPSSGRGRGQWDGGRMTPGSRYSGGRGRGHAFDAQPRSYFDKSMLEDPWKFLTPVIWQSDGDDTSFPNSWRSVKMNSSAKVNRGPVSSMNFGTKKTRVSNTLDKSSNEPSLAEFLAAAAAEAEGDEAGTV